MVAAKGGTDADANPRLRAALLACRAANMPKDNIDRVLKKAEGGDSEQYDEIRYEGYASGGVAVIVETLTDNRNRTASEVRATFSKFGGNLGESGSVNFMFDRVGQITYGAEVASDEAMFEGALEAGADNVESDASGHEITASIEDFNAVREAMEEHFGAPEESGLMWKPQTTTTLDADQAQSFLKLLDALDDLDDVQNVASNADIADEILAKWQG